MNSLLNLRIGRRLGLAFGSLLLLVALVAGVAVFELQAIQRNAVEFSANTVPSLRSINRLGADLSSIRRLETQHVMVDTAGEMDEYELRIKDLRESLSKGMAGYEVLVSDEQDRQLWLKAQAEVARYLAVWDKLRLMSRQTMSDPDAKVQSHALLFGDSREKFRVAVSAIEAMWKYNEELADVMVEQSAGFYRQALVVVGGLAVLSLVVGTIAAVFIARSITMPIEQTAEVLREVAEGNITVQVPDARGRDETSAMVEALKRMQASLVKVIGSVRDGSESVATASAEIAQGNSDLSQRTEQQASALQETAASMEQLNSTVRRNADNANQASQLARGATTVAQQGGQVVARVVDTMKDINESSRKVSEIITVIDGIAFQTNILALNAAVEAARAGEQGRGFAVVAGEVRLLAQRSAEAAKEIKSLIMASVERVDHGSGLVQQAGSTMSEIVTAIRRVNDIVSEISVASAEQASGVAQIEQAVGQMDRNTQQNAALVEESAAAAESLRNQAQQLAQAVGVFRLAAAPVVVSTPVLRTSAKKPPVFNATPASASSTQPRHIPATPERGGAQTRGSQAAVASAARVPASAEESGDWQSF